ncbi:Poly(A) polymerase central domain-containing protein [Xylaria bambusicola]|uniref:Poly(A) polymerase central domain-containing protein n=1 Tax=Xylaria bambusicola TaxID=326684 RepID=UPI002007A042|nr:Poly(A) polymerase central domain-containing protein [Xylaria bambusicola]KAI0512777.1 Poly(A) polymerase central domain-containing protein [Xylaria bambusicola]
MRPLHGDDAWAASQRHRDFHLTAPSAPNSHMSLFITDEASLDSHRDRPAAPSHSRDSSKVTEPSRSSNRDHARDDEPSFSPSSKVSLFSQSPASLPSQIQSLPVSRPITPLTLGPSCMGSADSSASSRRNSFASSFSDHVINSDHESAGEQASAPAMLDSGSAPQLVMPSIMMPSRRPFTETGKNLGRLKILLAGESGVGKTSLLKAIVQTCDHIVHVDPIPPTVDNNKTSRPGMATSKRKQRTSTTSISEIYASTRPYPEWWQESDAPSVSHKRKRLGDNVLERNICFVDTPGYGRGSSAMETIMTCVDYIESHLNKVSSDDLSDSDLVSMLGGGGGCQVDAVLYLISHTLKPADLEYIRRLTTLTNVIPVLTRAESFSEEQAAAQKQVIAGQLRDAGIKSFAFTPSAAQEKRTSSAPSIPYTASSATVPDHDLMDASLLMSPDYVQPLIPTDLTFLVNKIFSLDGASWLRHSAAKKYLQWREQTPHQPRHLYRPLASPAAGSDPSMALQQLSLSLAIRPGAQQQNDRTAQLQMADWAADLQHTLASERLRYETLARGERAVWLTERLHECVQDGTLVTRNGSREVRTRGRKGAGAGRHAASSKTQRHQDPLGLLQVAADLKAKSWMAVEVLGSLGMSRASMDTMEKTWGITGPISSALPTPAETQATTQLLEELRRQNTFETASESKKRENVVNDLQRIADEFVRKVARAKEPHNEVLIRDARGEVFTYGSFCLGVYGPGSDIDTLVTAPRYVTRDDYFKYFPDLLQEMAPPNAITGLTAVEEAFVPIIKFEYWGISIDLIFSRIATLTQFPPHGQLQLTSNEYLRGLDDRELRSLNGTRVTKEILNLVPEQSTFRTALRAIKLWAQRRAIYANIIGFPGGVVWAMMVARVCQLYPRATSATIVAKFFSIMKNWPWPMPVQLKKSEDGPLNVRVWNPKVYKSDSFHLMPVITPAYPQMCATFNITKSTKAIIQRELERGVELADKILTSQLLWKDLFVKHTFFTQDHKYYLAVIATSTTKEAHKTWSGFVESKVRILVGELERHPSVAIARPFNKGFERQHLTKSDEESTQVKNGSLLYVTKDEEDSADSAVSKGENGTDSDANTHDSKAKTEEAAEPGRTYTTTHYIGLELAEGAKSLDLSYHVNTFKQMCSEWEKYSAELNHLSVQHVKNINLPEDVFEPGEIRPARPLKKPVANGTAPITQRKRNAPTEGQPPPPKRQQSSAAAAAG